MKFHWKRYEITKELRPWGPLRIKAAERAVVREADAMPLFPELRRYHCVEERIQQMDVRSARIARILRDGRAKMWRLAREVIRQLPTEERDRLLKKWNTGYMPGGPADLFATARMLGILIPDAAV